MTHYLIHYIYFSLFIILSQNSLASFKEKILPFLDEYCYSCHDRDSQKGGLNLEQIKSSPSANENVAVWMEVMVHLREQTMPPQKKKKQPPLILRNEIKELLEKELFKSKTYLERLEKPEYANYLEHQKLFDGSIKSKSFTTARLWRRNPYIFNTLKKNLFNREQSKIKQPFGLEEKQQIRDYASLVYADSATLDTMMRNAEFIVDQQLGEAAIELYKRQNKGQLPPQYRPYKEIRKGKTKTVKPRLPENTLKEFSEIILHPGKPSEELIKQAIKKQYELFMDFEPSKRDYTKYLYLYKKNLKSAKMPEALRGMLIAIMLSPNAIYRSEIGLGEKDPYGRQFLSPPEIAYAVSFALTDRPDPGLIDAAKKGKLRTVNDVNKEVQRILFDDQIEKPRILRFFHEFFGYTHAPKVFKDDKRFVNRYTYDTLSQYMVSDADMLIKYILKQDKNVLKELLTTDKYFIAHSSDNYEMQNKVNAMYAVYDIIKNHKGKYPYNLEEWQKGVKQKITKAGEKFGIKNYRHFNGNSAERLRNTVSNALTRNITPTPDHRNINYINAYNLIPEEWDYKPVQPAKMPNSPRAGILTHPSWLISYSQNLDNDPVRRGKWIRERLLAGTIPDLPITVDAKIPEDPHRTLRERLDVTEKAECWKCHRKMNPLGNAFEMYDDFGKYRDVHYLDKKDKKVILETNRIKSMLKSNRLEKRNVDSSGSIDFSNETGLDGEIKNAVELMDRLSKSTLVRQSFVRHVFRFFMGRNEAYRDSQVLIAADKAYLESGGSFKALLASLLTSDSFLFRKKLYRGPSK